jgi:hypothetical protein
MDKENKTSDKPKNGNDFITDVSNSTVLEKPTMEKYGWHTQSGFDDEPSGWMYEGGEEAYYEALKKWEEQQQYFIQMEEKTNLDKIPSDIKYYLLGWKDRNKEDYIRKYGELRLRDLTLDQLHALFSYATTKDGALLARVAS